MGNHTDSRNGLISFYMDACRNSVTHVTEPSEAVIICEHPNRILG